MNENISRLMDGELDDDEFERCIGSLKSDDAMQTWVCYHVIGDQLRGARARVAGLRRAVFRRARGRADGARARARAAPRAARDVRVGGRRDDRRGHRRRLDRVLDGRHRRPTPSPRPAKPSTVRAAQVRPPAELPSDYLLAHQEYSPATAIQGGGPYLRAVATAGAEPRP